MARVKSCDACVAISKGESPVSSHTCSKRAKDNCLACQYAVLKIKPARVIHHTCSVSGKRVLPFVKNTDQPCCYCGEKLHGINHSFDHLIPKSKGGNHSTENLKDCCKGCNVEKGNKYLQQFYHHVYNTKPKNEFEITRRLRMLHNIKKLIEQTMQHGSRLFFSIDKYRKHHSNLNRLNKGIL